MKKAKKAAKGRLTSRRWERALWKRGAEPEDVIDCFVEYVGLYQEDVSRRGDDPSGSIIEVLFLGDAIRDDHLVIELAGRLFRVMVERIPDDQAHQLRLRSIHESDAFDAALSDPEEWFAQMIQSLRGEAQP